MGTQEQAPELPARSKLTTTEKFEQAREDYETRLNREFDQLGPAYVDVTYTPEDENPPRYETLYEHHRAAREKHTGDPHGVILVGHQDADGTTRWLGLSLLPSFRDQERCRSLRAFLETWQILQVRTRKEPPRAWSRITRKADAVGRLPVLVHAIHGTRSGTVLAPLSWYCEAVPERRTPR